MYTTQGEYEILEPVRALEAKGLDCHLDTEITFQKQLLFQSRFLAQIFGSLLKQLNDKENRKFISPVPPNALTPTPSSPEQNTSNL